MGPGRPRVSETGIVLDTNACSALQARRIDVLALFDDARDVLFSVVVLGELHSGFRSGTRRESNEKWLNTLMSDPRCRMVDVSARTADLYGEVSTVLRRLGNPIPTNDVWIAAQCIEADATLVSRDRHFEVVPGLRLIKLD